MEKGPLLTLLLFAKQLLSKFKDLSFKDLLQRGTFRDPVENEYHNSLLPSTYKNSQEINKNDFLVVNSLNFHFTELFIKKKKASHKKSLENEIKRLEDMEIHRLQEILRSCGLVYSTHHRHHRHLAI